MKSSLSFAIEVLHTALLSLWFGGAALLSFLVAPAAFRILPTNQLAGDLVGAVLAKLYLVGAFAGILLLFTSNWLRSRGVLGRGRVVALNLSLLIALGANVYAQWSVAPRVAELRRTAPPETDPLATDSRKAEFDRLHRRSVQLMAVMLVALLIAIASSAGRSAPKAPILPSSS